MKAYLEKVDIFLRGELDRSPHKAFIKLDDIRISATIAFTTSVMLPFVYTM